MKNGDKWKRVEVIFELLVFGIVIGVVEDIIAITVATDEPVTWGVVGTIVLVAIPFAILGEAIFDRIDFATMFRRLFGGHDAPEEE